MEPENQLIQNQSQSQSQNHYHNHIENTWTHDIEGVLENLRQNSLIMSEYHRNRYLYFKGFLKYFRIPTIILSGVNSVFSVGLQPFIAQRTISVITCMISLICAIITSLELFLSIQSTMENELSASKDFYLLGITIYKMLQLSCENRLTNGRTFLDEKFQEYCKLVEGTQVLEKKVKDSLAPLPKKTNEGILTRLKSNIAIGANKVTNIIVNDKKEIVTHVINDGSNSNSSDMGTVGTIRENDTLDLEFGDIYEKSLKI